MSNWAENIAKNAAAARTSCADKLGAISRLVSSSFDDLRHGNWHFYQNDHPYDHIEKAMVWAEALVRRVILSLVTEMRQVRETGSRTTPCPGQLDTDTSCPGLSAAQHRDPEQGDPGSSPGTTDAFNRVPGPEPGSPETSANVIPGAAHHDNVALLTRDPEPPRPYRPTFQWSELRPAPAIPTGRSHTTPRPKPRKHDFRTKIEARLALYAHMLEHREAYAKRLAFRLDAVGRIKAAPDPTSLPHVSVPSKGLEPTDCPAEPESEGKNPPPFMGVGGDQELNSVSAYREEEAVLSATHREASDLICGEAGGQTKDQLPKLLWSLYTTDPPPIDALRDDLVALHMAYEQP